MQDQNLSVGQSAADVLRQIRLPAIPAFVKTLKDSDVSVGAEAKIAVPQLILLLKDSDATVRSRADYALGRMGAEAKTAVPHLILLLKTPMQLCVAVQPMLWEGWAQKLKLLCRS